MRENKLLKLLNLVLELHKIRDGLVALVGIVYQLQTYVLLILKRAIELGVVLVER